MIERNGKIIEGIYEVEPKRQKAQTHKHPSNTKNAKVEVVPKYVGSLGDVNTEGCLEHNEERYVQSDVIKEIHKPNKLTEYIVFSEIIGKPKCKR